MNNIQNIYQIVLLMLLSTILFGCQSVPRIHSIVDKAAQFDGYATYGFHPTLLPKKDEYDSLSYRYIKSAIHNEMLNKGYKYALEPELWVNFNVYVKDKIKINNAPSACFYYNYRQGYDVWGDYPIFEERVTQYTEGTLNIDLIDNKTNRLLWEGIAVGRVSENTYDNLEAKINEAVALIFRHLSN
jgi:hypothetical protein